MAVAASAGSKIFIGTTQAILQTDTFTEIQEVRNMQAFGRVFAKVTHTSLGQRGVKKFKGEFDDGSMMLELGYSPSDPGQIAVAVALQQDFDYNFKVTLNDTVTPPTIATVTLTIAAPGVVNLTAHGLVAGTPVTFSTTGNLPTGLAPSTTYYVIATGLTANAFSVAASLGGAAIAFTGVQAGIHTIVATVGTPTTFYFKAKCLSNKFNVGTVQNIVTATVDVEINSGSIIMVQAT